MMSGEWRKSGASTYNGTCVQALGTWRKASAGLSTGHCAEVRLAVADTEARGTGHQAEVILGRNVARLRRDLRMPMRRLRERSGVPISVISRVEHGFGTSVRVAARLASGLGVSLPDLLQDGTTAEDPGMNGAGRGYAQVVPRPRATLE